MMGVGYTGGKIVPEYRVKEKFAWHPVLTAGGQWVWGRKYVKLMKIIWGPAGEPPVIYATLYTEAEWTMECLRAEYIPPPVQKKLKPAPPPWR